MKLAFVAGLAVLAVIPLWQSWRRGRAARALHRWQHLSEPVRWPPVSIVIPAWQERGTLERCLAKLRGIDYDDFEVIVVAGGPDGTLLAAEQQARTDSRISVVCQSENGGKNAAMNDGARRATKEILVFLDADALVTPGWLKAMVAALGERYSASTGKFHANRQTLVSLTGEMSQVLENEARGRVILQGSGGMAVRRSAFEALGGIPEGRFADDWALSARLQQEGHLLAYAPAALLYSDRPATLEEWWRNELRWRRIHLLTLFNVARVDLQTPLSAAKALYPYLVAWTVACLTLATVAARAARLPYSWLPELGWACVVIPTFAREAGGAVETAAYTGQPKWLRTVLILPILIILSWVASAVASVTTRSARLHFKGPRQEIGGLRDEAPAEEVPSGFMEAEAHAEATR